MQGRPATITGAGILGKLKLITMKTLEEMQEKFEQIAELADKCTGSETLTELTALNAQLSILNWATYGMEMVGVGKADSMPGMVVNGEFINL